MARPDEPPPGLELDPRHPRNVADPYPLYHWLQEHEPVHWCPPLRSWLITRHDDVLEVFRQPLRFSSERFGALEAGGGARESVRAVNEVLGQWFVFRDPPDHTRLRKLLHRTFTPTQLRRIEPRIQTTIDELLDLAAGQGRVDVIADLAFPLPAMVIAVLLGAPTEDIEPMKRWSDRVAVYLGGATEPVDLLQEARDGLHRLVDYFDRLLVRKRTQPADDLMSLMLAACHETGEWSQKEVVSNCVLLLFAGHETTTNLIGNGLWHLLRSGRLAALAGDPSLAARAVEECLRIEGPVPAVLKRATEAVAWHGRAIARDDMVMPVIAAANRDPRRFRDPDVFDIQREPGRNLAFSHGIHFCLGAPLARLEARLAFDAVARRWPRARLVSPAQPWKPMLFFRGVERLEIELG